MYGCCFVITSYSIHYTKLYDTLDEIKQMKNVVKTQKATVDSQITQLVVELSEAEMNTTMYYCLYVHSGDTSKLSNVIPVTLQAVDSSYNFV